MWGWGYEIYRNFCNETEQKVDEPFETLADEIIRFNEEINNNKEEFEKEKKAQRKNRKI